MTQRRLGSTVGWLLWLLGESGCELVDHGPAVGVPGRCAVSSDLFVTRVVPDYLEAHDCAAAAGCHAADNGNSIYLLEDVSGELAPLPADPPGAWPPGWQANYERTVAEITDCDIAELSPLYSEPAGGDTTAHGGGDLFAPRGPELDLIQQWLDSSGT